MENLIAVGAVCLVVGVLLAWAFMAKFKSGNEEEQVDKWLTKRIDDPKTPAFIREQLIKARDLKLQEIAQKMDSTRMGIADQLSTEVVSLKARLTELEKKVSGNP